VFEIGLVVGGILRVSVLWAIVNFVQTNSLTYGRGSLR